MNEVCQGELLIFTFVGERGVEPPIPYGNTVLNRARLPVPPLALIRTILTDFRFGSEIGASVCW